MTTPSKDTEHILDFVGSVCTTDPTRIEADLGHGYVKLKSSEAERRQALQDIQCSEDILLELLRNSRDANAKNIFIALKREGDVRTIVVIDDGDGIPLELKDSVFDARVTSKLDSAHMDDWGMHGRGMALFSIRSNVTASKIVDTGHKLGTAIRIESSLESLGEKADQTTFPHFEKVDETFVMRGPKNLLRCAAEFCFAHKDEIDIRIGSFSEIASALYMLGKDRIPLTTRTFSKDASGAALVDRLAFAHDPASFKLACQSIGLDISERSARRIIDGDIPYPPTLFERMKSESFPHKGSRQQDDALFPAKHVAKPHIKLDREDMGAFTEEVANAFALFAEKYYLVSDVEIDASVRDGALRISIPLVPEE